MRKPMKVLLAVLAAAVLLPVLLLLGLLAPSLIGDAGGYAWTINHNWELDLPMEDACLYEADDGPSFHGDGLRYHVLEYADTAGLEAALETQAEALASLPAGAEAILDGLSVPADWRPDPAACRGFTAPHPTDERNELYLLLAPDGIRLYVLESFL